MTATTKKGHQYYYCTNGKGICTQHKKYLRENDAYKLIAAKLADLKFSERKIELLYKAAKEKMERAGGESKHAFDHLNSQLAALQEKESKLLDTFLAEQISKELYDRKASEIQLERIALTKQIQEFEKHTGISTLEPVKEVFLQASKAQKEFLDASPEKKRTIVEKLLWNLSIENKSVASIKYKSQYFPLAKADKNAPISTLLGD